MNKNIDTQNMFGAIWDFPDTIMEAMKIGSSLVLQNDFSQVDKVVVAGMGGSAIGGDVTAALIQEELTVPFIISRGYQLPNWVDDHTLVICSSYSGDTEETLSALNDAQIRNALICSITTGGALVEKCLSSGFDVIKIPGGLQPRAALAFSFVPMLYLLEKIGSISLKLSILAAVLGITSIEKLTKKSLRLSLTFLFFSFEEKRFNNDIISPI